VIVRLSALISAGSTNTASTAPIKAERFMNPSFADNSFAQWPDIPNGHRPTLPPYLGDLRLPIDPLKVDRRPLRSRPDGRDCNAVQQDTCPCRRLRPVGAVVSTRANDEALGTLSKYRRWRAKAPLSLSSVRDGLPGRVSDSTAEKPGLAAHYGAQTMAPPPEPAAKTGRPGQRERRTRTPLVDVLETRSRRPEVADLDGVVLHLDVQGLVVDPEQSSR